MFNLSYASFANAWRRYATLDDNRLQIELGWAHPPGQRGNGALITSLALLTLGMPLPGTHLILAGPLTGSRAFTGANRLADWLGQRYAPSQALALEHGLAEAAATLYGRRGILAFIQGSGPQGGLIGLLDGTNAQALCRAADTKHPLEARFWELR